MDTIKINEDTENQEIENQDIEGNENIKLITFRHTKAEYVGGVRKGFIYNKTIHKYDFFLFPLIFLFVLLYGFLTTFSTFIVVGLTIGAIALCLMVYLYCLYPLVSFKRNGAQQECIFSFSDEGIKIHTQAIHSEIKWDYYQEFWENKEFYYLTLNKRSYTLIPKRIFQSSAARQNFENTAAANIKKPLRTFKK